jgi:hypothetical protein
MSKKKSTKREKEIMKSMGLDYHTTKLVSEIGRICGSHKYDVWIGREVSKNLDLLDRYNDFQYIIDWAKKERPDIFSLSFEDAFANSKSWHNNLKFKKVKKHPSEILDKETIIYTTKNNKYFFKLLNSSELSLEGNIMKNCVSSYGNKILKGHSLIISMRDMKNQPHVTIEVDIKTSSVTQVRGKANERPSKEYMKAITEFAIYASGFEEDFDQDILNVINLNFQ